MPRTLIKLPASRRPSGNGNGTKPTSPVLKKNAPTSAESNAADNAVKFTKRIGISYDSLKKVFTSESPSDDIKRLKELIADRVKSGRYQGLKDWRVYAAIDEAYNAPFHQITPTLINKILDGSGKMKPEEVAKEFERWGLSVDNLFVEVPHPVDKKRRIKVINYETFRKVLVPIVKSVLNARESRLYNERNNNPFFVYSPNRQTEEHKAIGDIITQIVEAVVTQYGLRAVLKTAIHQALKYSFAMLFPCEAWHYEEDNDEKGDLYTKKEGLRYNIPHPTRCAWDQNFPPSTFNTDTGCEWALYWRLYRFGDVDANPVFYNKDKISFGRPAPWFGGLFDAYFEQVYPCTPRHASTIPTGDAQRDRELHAQTYTRNDYDKSVFLTDVFMKLSPKQWGLGEWTHKLWFRFVVANDDSIVYAEPLPYAPIRYLGTDADNSQSNATASFALDALPWQDLVSNILRQHLIALKQNSVKVIPYDKYQVNQEMLHEIKANMRNPDNVVFIPFDSREARVAQVDPSRMFPVVQLTQTNTVEIISTITQVFNIMERALGISAQEVGAIAGHIQTAEEIRTVSQNMSARVEFLASFIDEFVDAWKRQIYDAMQAFMDEEFIVYIGGITDAVAKKLKDEYGFELGKPFEGKVEIRGKKSKLSVDAFISTREGSTRINQPQIAAVIMQTVQAIAGSELLSQYIKPEDLLALINRAMKLAGAPEDADIKANPEASTMLQMKQLAESMQEMVKQVTQAAATQAAKMATRAATQQAGKMVEQGVSAVAEQVGPAIQETQQVAAAAAQGVQQMGAAHVDMQQKIQEIQAVLAQLMQMIAPPPVSPMPNGVLDNAPMMT